MTRDETQKSSSMPTLDAEGFQRLLTAAYILQSRSETVWQVDVADTSAFAATAIHPKRTPSVRTISTQSSRMKEANIPSGRACRIFWKQVEAFGIAGVFCLMGMSIHRLSRMRLRKSLSATTWLFITELQPLREDDFNVRSSDSNQPAGRAVS